MQTSVRFFGTIEGEIMTPEDLEERKRHELSLASNFADQKAIFERYRIYEQMQQLQYRMVQTV